MEEHVNIRTFYGTRINDNGKYGHNVSFDEKLVENKKVHVKRGNMSSVVDPCEEEQECDHIEEECKNIEDKQSSTQLKSQREFYDSPDDITL